MAVSFEKLIIEKKIITPEQLQMAELAKQIGDFRRGIDPGDHLAKIIITLGFASPKNVAVLLAQSIDAVSYIIIDGYPVDPQLPSIIKQDVVSANKALPLIREVKKMVIVAAEKPLPPAIAKQYALELDIKDIIQLPLTANDLNVLIGNVYKTLEMRQGSGVRLGEILVREGLVSQEAVDSSIKDAQAAGMPLGRYLIRSKQIDEGTLASLLAAMADIPLLEYDEASSRIRNSNIKQRLKKEYVRYNLVIPYEVRNKTLEVITSNPFVKIPELAAAYNCNKVELFAVSESTFAHIFSKLYGEEISKDSEDSLGAVAPKRQEETSDLATQDEDDIRARYEHLVNRMILRAIELNASDIHIENYDQEVQVRLRVDGVLHVLKDCGIDKDTLRGVINILKIEGGMNIAENRVPQGGSFRKIAPGGSPYDFRVQIVPTVNGESAVVRLLPGKKRIPTLKEIGFPQRILDGFERSINNPSGLILVTGPTGSGKTTTLCSALAHVAQDPTCKVLTVEDPVEYQLPNVTQVETIYSKGLDFSAAARAFMRMDPDVILIGEIRDQETANEALKLAYSGHLTFSTLHTSSSIATVERMVGFDLDRTLLVEQMLAINSQRLMRRLCPFCREPYTPTDFDIETILYQGIPEGMRFFQSKGCKHCYGLGHGGRTMLAEFLNFTGNTRSTFRRENEQNLIYVQLMGKGLEPMIDDAFNKVHQGYIDVRWLPEVIPQDFLEIGPSAQINIGPDVPVYQPGAVNK